MEPLTNRERVRRCAQCLPIDRAPFSFYFGLRRNPGALEKRGD